MTLSLALVLSVSTGAFAQKGHGKGGGGGHGNQGGGGKHQNQGGGNQGRGNGGGGGWKKQMGGWQQPQAQPRQVYQQPRQVRQAPQQVYQVRGNGNGRGKAKGNGNGGWKKQQRVIQRVYNAPVQQSWGGGHVPPGQIRKQEVHARNAERKFAKQQEKAFRKYERESRRSYAQIPQPIQRVYRERYNGDGRYYDDRSYSDYDRGTRVPRTYGRRYDQYRYQGPVAPQYNPGYFAYQQYQEYPSSIFNSGYYGYEDEYADDGGGWKQQLVRTLISSVLGGFLNGGDYDNYADDRAYGNYDYYANGPVRYAYNDAYSYGGYAPRYAAYAPSYAYSSYGEPAYGYAGYGDTVGQIGGFPLGGLLGNIGGGDYVSRMFGEVLAQGYLQGLFEGQLARENGYGDDGYYDPYVSEEGIYDPFSSCIGQNRRLMSEGYDLGFEDALAGRQQFDPEEVGSVDLVSLLLGDVLRLG